MTGAHRVPEALALLARQWALGRHRVRLDVGPLAARAPPVRGVRRLKRCDTCASSPCRSARRSSSRCSTAPTSSSTASSRCSGWRRRSCPSTSSSACARRSPAGPSARRSWSWAGSRSCRASSRAPSTRASSPWSITSARDARLRPHQARRRAVSRLDRALQPVAIGQRLHVARHLRLGLPPARPGADARRARQRGRHDGGRGRRPLLDLDPHRQRRLLRRAHRQPLAALQRRLRRGALAGRRLQPRPAVRLHVRRSPRGDDDDPGQGAARASSRRAGWRGRSRERSSPSPSRGLVWRASIARYTSAGG